MKKIFLVLAICAASLLVFNTINAQSNNSSTSVLRHIVIITFKQNVPADSIKVLDDLYMNLSKNPMVKDFEMGVNISTRDSGVIKHVYVTSFTSKEDIDSYRKLLAYSKLFKVSLPVAEDVTVADYWAKK